MIIPPNFYHQDNYIKSEEMSVENTTDDITAADSTPDTVNTNPIPEKYRHRTLINQKYIFEKKIGAGSFGCVYRGKNVISGDHVAIKYEATEAKIPTLLWESKILNHLAGKQGVVKLRYYGTESNKNIIVMDLFSHTLCEEIEKIKRGDKNTSITTKPEDVDKSTTASSPDEAETETVLYEKGSNTAHASSGDDGSGSMGVSQTIHSQSISPTDSTTILPSVTPHTIEMVKYLISMIEIISRVHEAGVVHRDIKPENFMLSVDKRLHIIDFGLSRFYMKGEKHIINTCDKSIVGTMRYISTHIHDGNVYSRRDDIISIMYVTIYLLKGKLPWMGIVPQKGELASKDDIVYAKKVKTTITELCEGIPYLFQKLLDYSYSLGFEEKPDYSYMTRQCKNYLKLYI